MLRKIILVFSVFTLVLSNESFSQKKTEFRDKNVREIKNRVIENLQILDNEYLQKLSYRDYKKAREIIIESYNLLKIIPDNGAITDDGMELISDLDFQNLCNDIKSESFESDKIYVIQLAAKYNLFTVDQLITLINLMNFSNDKIEVVKIVYPNVIDKYNSYSILNAFTHSSDKDRVRKIIDNFPDK